MKKSLKVLIVEDDESSLMLLVEFFKLYDFDVYVCNDGVSAIEFIELNRDTDLILMDLRMPTLNGIEASKRILEVKPEMIIIAQSAYVKSDTKKLALDIGINAFFTKPLVLVDLMDYIENKFDL